MDTSQMHVLTNELKQLRDRYVELAADGFAVLDVGKLITEIESTPFLPPEPDPELNPAEAVLQSRLAELQQKIDLYRKHLPRIEP